MTRRTPPGVACPPPKWRRDWTRALSTLYTTHPRLRGVSPTADFLHDAVRWSA